MGGVGVISDVTRNLLNSYIENLNIQNEFARSHELEALELLDLLDRTRQKWAEEVRKNVLLQKQTESLESELNALRNDLLASNEQLRHARAQIVALVSEKEDLKLECSEMDRKFRLVKELLKNEFSHLSSEQKLHLAFLNHGNYLPKHSTVPQSCKLSRVQDDEVDYDKTEETMNHSLLGEETTVECRLRNGKVYRRSQINTDRVVALKRTKTDDDTSTKALAEEKGMPAKRIKDSAFVNTNTLVTTLTVSTADEVQHTPTRVSLNRSFSEPDFLASEKRIGATLNDNPLSSQCTASSVIDIRTPLVPLRSWTRGSSIECRNHTFTHYTSIIGDKCDVCVRWIGIGGKPAFKCIDCNLHLHKACASRAPLPCVPHVPTPRTPGKQKPRLKDFCPTSQPMIPHLIIHCVLALEKYYLHSEGLYRVPGQESQILKLLNEFRNSRFRPRLKFQDPETITGCIKRFLKQLRDSLIPSSSWDEFVAAAKEKNQKAIDRCVNDLPIPNRDTLAFLCSHFQKVCESSDRNRMTPEVLARSVAPTIVGRSPMRAINFAQGNDEAAKQTQVMLALLNMPHDYWPRFYSCGGTIPPSVQTSRILMPSEKQRIAEKKFEGVIPLICHNETRISPSAADRSILGPIRTPPIGFKTKQLTYHRKNICLNPY